MFVVMSFCLLLNFKCGVRGGEAIYFVYIKQKQLLNMLCNARFCKYFVRFFFLFLLLFQEKKKKKNITVSNEFICVIKSGIQTTAGLYFVAIPSHEHVNPERFL